MVPAMESDSDANVAFHQGRQEIQISLRYLVPKLSPSKRQTDFEVTEQKSSQGRKLPEQMFALLESSELPEVAERSGVDTRRSTHCAFASAVLLGDVPSVKLGYPLVLNMANCSASWKIHSL